MMSESSKLEEEQKEKRRRKHRENGGSKGPIKVVSSLGDGNLIDRFQNAVSEKKERKKKHEKSEKSRQLQKEKRLREVAKFRAEIDALMVDSNPELKPSEKMATFVPKLSGTVKGKFEELEKRKREEEKKKAENERRRRTDKDLRDKKMIEIEIAKKKIQEDPTDIVACLRAARICKKSFTLNGASASLCRGNITIKFQRELAATQKTNLIAHMKRKLACTMAMISVLEERQNEHFDSEDENIGSLLKKRNIPGKLVASQFEELAKQRIEQERNKSNLERKMKMEAERQAFRDMHSQNRGEISDEETTKMIPATSEQIKPQRLATRFDEIAKAREEELRRKAEEDSRMRLEEEKRNFREQRLASRHGSSSSEESETDTQPKPQKLSAARTKFDEIAKERMEQERLRIKERRQKLLEEEIKIFEESKKSLKEHGSSSSGSSDEQKESKRHKPRRLDSSFTKSDIAARQKLYEKREKIQSERAMLLEEERKMFGNAHQFTSNTESDVSSASVFDASDREVDNERDKEKRTKKLTKRRKKAKSQTEEQFPSRLDSSKLKFDVLERQRIEKERRKIQEQRRNLLEEEKRIFEEARKQRLQNLKEKDDNAKPGECPSKLEYSKTRFDIMAQHKMEEERQRIREERSRLLREEKRIFEEEKRRMKLENTDAPKSEDESANIRKPKKPSRLDKSFTEFDVLEKRKKEQERERIKRESQLKLEEEKRQFREAKQTENCTSSEESDSPDNSNSPKIIPGKLSKHRTDFEEMEKRRIENERKNAYDLKLKQLNEEKRLFAEARKFENQSSESDRESTVDKNFPDKLPPALTNFEQTEKRRLEKERIESQERKIKKIEEELTRFKYERELMNDSDKEERSEVPTPQVAQPRPKKLSTTFIKFDEIARLNQKRENERRKEEKARELEEERKRFQSSKENYDSSDSDDEESSGKQIHRPINKLNVRDQMEAVLQAQRETEQKRIMETKFCRMTVEQQEMYLAKEAQLKMLREKLAEAEADFEEESASFESEAEYDSEDDNIQTYEATGSNSSKGSEDDSVTSSQASDETTSSGSAGPYTGAPWFTETLTNITLTEGKPVRFDAVIHADPHPRVTWYFRNRLIRNSPDYQYMNKGTQYSLYMNESFYDDSGEYVCKAENSKGVATSKAILTVLEQ